MPPLLSDLETLQHDALRRFTSVVTKAELETCRIDILGRKGKLAGILSGLATLSPEEKRDIGQKANFVKNEIEGAFAAAEARIAAAQSGALLQNEWLDITLPPVESTQGHLHLTSQAIEEITDIFHRLSFVRARHPEVDSDYYAFEALNMPGDHPARDDWETFFIAEEKGKMPIKKGEKIVLTPHTSNGQVREMEKRQLPIRMISIGKCYRRQASARHLPMFHQFEGLMIDKDISIVHLRGVFDYFVKSFFGENTRTRLRPYHFRFTEPSFELDISCTVCNGAGSLGGKKCKLCKGGWLELGGAGMVHPNVLKAGGINPNMYSGFAFGWGVERTLMMRSGLNIDDIRILYKNDLRFLRQF